MARLGRINPISMFILEISLVIVEVLWVSLIWAFICNWNVAGCLKLGWNSADCFTKWLSIWTLCMCQDRTGHFFHHQVIGLATKTSCSKSVLYNTLNQTPKWLNKILQLHWVSFNGDRIIFKIFQTIRDFPCKNTFNDGGFFVLFWILTNNSLSYKKKFKILSM